MNRQTYFRAADEPPETTPTAVKELQKPTTGSNLIKALQINWLRMEKAAISGGFFKVPSLWGHASSGHTKTYKPSIAKSWQQINPTAEALYLGTTSVVPIRPIK
jgi:hypothetical protein